MTIEDLITGLRIISRNTGGYCVAAEHDVIYAGGDESHKDSLTADEISELESCGWFWHEDTESWGAYV